MNSNGPKVSKPSKGGGDKGLRNLVIGMLLFIVLVGVGFSVSTNKTKTSSKLPASVSKADGWGIVFNKTVKPQIDIWEDFQCPVCQRFEAVNNTYINEIIKAGKAKVVFHPMSFIGNESLAAANAVACANDQGKFLELHTLLYQNQAATENSGKFTTDFLTQIGKVAGITNTLYDNCVVKGDYVLWTKNIEGDAAGKNINSTPTVFVNGKELDRKTQYMDAVAFKKALSDAGVK
jgi:protein-disulfide isomerase